MMRVVFCEFLLAGHWVEYGKLVKKRFESSRYNTMSDSIYVCVLINLTSPSVKILLL